MTRILDELDHPFYELKQACLSLILSMTEGFKKKIIAEISVRVTPSILLDQIERLIKKIYIKQLIEDDMYSDAVRRNLDAK